MATLIGTNHVTCIAQLEKLVSAGVLEKTIGGSSYLYKPKTHSLVQQVILPLIVEEHKLYGQLKKEMVATFSFFCRGIVIYGSYSENKETSQSDIDVCFIVDKKEAVFQKKLDAYTEEIEAKYDLVFEPLILTLSEFVQKQTTGLLQAIIEKGDWLVGNPQLILGAHEKNR